ncbi:DNA polymerase interacting tetratricopeptide repeat-containing, protein of 47 kDa [Episyrphus balteatus]|uniref:DNA polymerase interacting tetratricopeptide repeat-containing, protein of 47 kDa n=1 Tax=Episyrphus balteatus TaxID=286459 RepID=UPI002486B427|nr:DNA polymerase interacting tetratricopeptide repeat-containing, protein of 47 kDa [Episyrphus balteatus]XP_055854613.1 DNA polymerase interacting tetratricopeptide repeat-containing, protein of 47 kDa [Episyrphus balteatus]
MSENEKNSKLQMTDEERLELAKKLDQELDEFIGGLEKKRYTEGWPEDRWQEEMDKHPFFMKKPPQPGDEVHPLFEGLQKLKYDPDENTAEDLALSYKEDGNFYVKHKKYRMGVYSYTEGLKAKCDNPEVLATLYNNRSASHFFLKNYRSALVDAEKALEYKPNYAKCKWRAAQSAFFVNKFENAIEHCEQILDENPENTSAKELIKNVIAKKLEVERNERKAASEVKKKLTQFHHTIDLLKERGVKFDDIKPNTRLTEELLRPKFLPLEDFPVHIDEDNILIWPAAFSYPEFMFSDFQQNLNEDALMADVVQSMFTEPLPCDKDGKYKPGKISVYYENRKAASVSKVDLSKTIKEIVTEKNFYVSGGSLLFFVVPTHSHIEKDFINETRRPMVYT